MALPGMADTVEAHRPAQPVCLYVFLDVHIVPLSSIEIGAIRKSFTLQTLGILSVGTHRGQHDVRSSTVSYPFGQTGQTGLVTSICVLTLAGKHGLATSTQV